MISRKKENIRKVLRIIVIILIINLALSVFVTKIVYDSVFARFDVAGGKAGAEYEELSDNVRRSDFMSGDNKLSAWLYGDAGDSLVVIAQGYRSASSDYVSQILSFTEHGRDVFIFDMTGSCESEGDSAVGFSQAVYDLDAALDHIEEEYDYDDIFIFGYSRGGYAACCMLDGREDITAVACVNGINSAMEAIISPVADKIGFLAYGNYPLLWLYQSMLFDAKTVSMSCAEEINESDVPVLVVHGEDDETVPIDEYSIISHKDEITGGNARYLTLKGDHTSVLYGEDGASANDELMDAVNDFFDESTEKGR